MRSRQRARCWLRTPCRFAARENCATEAQSFMNHSGTFVEVPNFMPTDTAATQQDDSHQMASLSKHDSRPCALTWINFVIPPRRVAYIAQAGSQADSSRQRGYTWKSSCAFLSSGVQH